MSTDWDWEQFGDKDPFWAVITLDKYRDDQLSDAAIEEFYYSGDYQVNWIFETIRKFVYSDFAPASALDFGCGVGRLTLGLAKKCASVVGVDVSSGMLRKAQLRCDQTGVKNLALVHGDDDLSRVEGKFDLITSFIVIQHIPANRGEQLFRRLLDLLNDGGVGALHVTYSRGDIGPDALRAANVVPSAPAQPSTVDRLTALLSPATPPAAPAPGAQPVMQMNGYDLNRLFHDMQNAGVRRFHTEFTDHGGTYGVMLFFRKLAGEPYTA